MTQMNISMKQEQNHGRIIDWWLPKVGGVGVGASRCKLFMSRMDKQQGLT